MNSTPINRSATLGQMLARLFCSALCVPLIATICGCSGEDHSATDAPPPVVRVAKPIVREVTDYVYFTGRTDAVQSVDLQARVTGYLDSVDFKAGTEVKAGQQLFKIDPRPYQAALDAALGQVKLAEAQVKVAAADYARAVNIARTPGAISQQDIDRYAAAEEEANAQLDASKANAESARLNLEFTTIASPVDGLIGRNYPSARQSGPSRQHADGHGRLPRSDVRLFRRRRANDASRRPPDSRRKDSLQGVGGGRSGADGARGRRQ